MAGLLIAAAVVGAGSGAALAAAGAVDGLLTLLDADHEGRIAHEYVWPLPPGAVAQLRLAADFDARLIVLDEAGQRVAEGYGEESVDGNAFVVDVTLGPVRGGEYRLRISSWSEEETGAYTLAFAARAPRRDGAGKLSPLAPGEQGAPRRAAPAGPVRDLALDEVVRITMPPGQRMHRYRLPVHPGGGVYDVWLFADADFDLYGGVTVEGEVWAEDLSQGGYGNEQIRLVAPPGADGVYVNVALYEDAAEPRTYFLLARRSEAEQAPGYWPTGPGAAGSPYGGLLVPGERAAGEIRAGEYSAQFWTLRVPAGTRRLAVGLFEAEADLDMALVRGWGAGAEGSSEWIVRETKRWNERLTLEAEGGELRPGIYTVAVWQAGSGFAGLEGAPPGRGAPSLRYGIEVALDAPLPASWERDALAPEVLGRLSLPERSRAAAVWIEGELSGGAGALVTPDGLILTNYHVLFPCHPAPDVPTGCLAEPPGEEPAASHWLVWMADPRTQRTEQRFAAAVFGLLPEYDLALLEIVADVDGEPLPGAAGAEGGLELPALAVAAGARAAAGGDEVVVIEYPGGEPAAPPVTWWTTLEEPVTGGGRALLWPLAGARAPAHSGAPALRPSDGALLGLTSARFYAALGPEAAGAARPASLLPEEWLEAIRARGGRVAGDLD